MRTACMLRRSWSQLHPVSRRIVGSSYTPLQGRSPHIATITLGERFSSQLSGNPSVLRFGGCGRSVSALAPALRHGYWSAYRAGFRQEGNPKSFPSGLSWPTGVRGLLSSEDEFGCPSATPVNFDSKCRDEFDTGLKEEQAFSTEKGDNENGKLRQWGDTRDTNDCASLPQWDDERSHTVTWDERGGAGKYFVSRELFAYPASAYIAGGAFRGGRLDTTIIAPSLCRRFSSDVVSQTKPKSNGKSHNEEHGKTHSTPKKVLDYSQRAVVTALWCNFLVFSLKLGVWFMTSSHVMLAETIHSLADLANQGLIAYGLVSSRRAPDAMHPYGYSKERFVWSLISAVGIFCLGSGATILHGVQNLWNAEPLENTYLAALVLSGSMIMEGASLLVAISCVRNGAKAEGMSVRDYLWGGHDPTTVAVMAEDGAAVAGLAVAGLALTAVHYTGNPMWDPIGSIVVGNLLGAVAIFLIQRNRHALLGRSMDEQDMMRVLNMLAKDPVVDAIYDCKSEMIGPGAYRFKAEIDFNGVTIVQNYLQRAGRGTWQKEFQDAVSSPEPGHLDRVMAAYGEEVVSALGSEVDRLERQIQKVVPGIRHVDIEAHNPHGPVPREKLYLPLTSQDNVICT